MKLIQQRMNLQIIDLFRENEILQIELNAKNNSINRDSDKENQTPERKFQLSPRAPSKKRKLGRSTHLNSGQKKLKFWK